MNHDDDFNELMKRFDRSIAKFFKRHKRGTRLLGHVQEESRKRLERSEVESGK